LFSGAPGHGTIDLKTRSLCSIGILASLGRLNALKINFTLAMDNGASLEKIVEALLQVAIYAGYPAALDALVLLDKTVKSSRKDLDAISQRNGGQTPARPDR
jgi:alkylhydroperoxidase/carboxymuconolactone decarboxylase family protein YurZ